MSHSASPPPDPKPKRPTIRARRPTLPPLAPPPRKEDGSPARRTLPPMPVVPQLAAVEPSDPFMDETMVRDDETLLRPGDDLDTSAPGITEVKSALRFNRRHRIPAEELFEASTNKIDRHRLLREAGLLEIKDETTAPTLKALPPHARSTMQVAPGDLERMRRLSESLEKDSRPVLELVDSVELSQDDLVDDDSLGLRRRHVVAKTDVLDMSASRVELGDDDVIDESEAETLGGNDLAAPTFREAEDEAETLDGSFAPSSPLPAPRAPSRRDSPRSPELSDPELQAFRGNEDWNTSSAASELRIESGGRPVVGATGETPWMGPSVVRFAEEDEALPPADVSFEDDRSPVPDLRPESLEVHAVSVPATLASPHVYSAHDEGAYEAQAYEAQAYQAPVHEAPARGARTVPQIASEPPHRRESAAPPAHVTAPLGQFPSVVATGSGFAPLSPGVKMRSPGQAFVPQTSMPQAYPALTSAVPLASTPSAFASPYPQRPPQESGPIPTTSNDVSRSRVEKPGWAAPVLFVAVLVAALLGAYFVVGPRFVGAPAAAAQAPTPSAPVVVAPAATAPPVATQPMATQPVATQPTATKPVAAPPSATLATISPSALPQADAKPHPAADKKPAAKAPKAPPPPPAKKTASGPSSLGGKGPVADDGPKPQQAPPAAEPAPSMPNLSGLGDVLNGAL